MPDEPDIYADGFFLTVTPYGCTLTLYRTAPIQEDALAGRHVVGCVRLGHLTAQELGVVIAQNVHAVAMAEPTGKTN